MASISTRCRLFNDDEISYIYGTEVVGGFMTSTTSVRFFIQIDCVVRVEAMDIIDVDAGGSF